MFEKLQLKIYKCIPEDACVTDSNTILYKNYFIDSHYNRTLATIVNVTSCFTFQSAIYAERVGELSSKNIMILVEDGI